MSQENGDSNLRSYWHPVARSTEVTDQPRRFVLLDEPLVLFRTDAGPSAFKDLCIHRGTALSLGTVMDGRITCAYHGWQYDNTGACVRIPSLPEGSSIPRKARAIAYQAVDAYDLVWVCMGEPKLPIPTWPNNEQDDPAYHYHISSHNVWNTSAGRATENFMDYTHFPFVHPYLLGLPDRTVVERPVVVEDTPFGFKFMTWTVEPEAPTSGENELVRFEYTYYAPFTIHVRKITSDDAGDTYVSQIASPTSAKVTNTWVVFRRTYGLDLPDEEFDEFSNRVLEQDRRISESQRPEEIPMDLREELHLKTADASGIALRRVLAEIGADAYIS